jgi:hypothetical protein
MIVFVTSVVLVHGNETESNHVCQLPNATNLLTDCAPCFSWSIQPQGVISIGPRLLMCRLSINCACLSSSSAQGVKLRFFPFV